MTTTGPSTTGSIQGAENINNDRKRKRSNSPVAALSTELIEVPSRTFESPTTAEEIDDVAIPLSKNQQKKLLKKQKWEESRESRRALRREKIAAKRVRQREERKVAKANPQNEITTNGLKAGKKRKNNRKLERKSKRLAIKCIVDCSFDDYMMDKEVASLGAQVSRCYSDNRIAKFSMDLWVTCVDKRLRSHLHLMHGDKWKSWRKIHVTDTDYDISKEDIQAGDIIYLSSDSNETLETLEEGKTYIVGGIVDKNRYKGLCFNKAVGQGLRTAKLPIGEYIKMTGRITLTTNQVVEIMLRWLELKDWKTAFEAVIPTRKKKKDVLGGQSKDGEDGEQDVDGSISDNSIEEDDVDLSQLENLDDSESDDIGGGDTINT